MTYLSRVIFTSSIVAAVGLVAWLLPIGRAFEERFGLDILFSMRGVRTPPKDVVVVAIDKVSADCLGLGEDLRKWPRSLHGRLIELLRQRGASVIVFDIMFEEPRPTNDDQIFAEAMTRAGNVVLCCYLKAESAQRANVEETVQHPENRARLVKLGHPVPALHNVAAAVSPFPLPKVPQKLSRYWTFKPEAGDIPTLPVVALHIFSLDALGRFEDIAAKTGLKAGDLFLKENGQWPYRYEGIVSRIRAAWESDPKASARLAEELERSRGSLLSQGDYTKLRALMKVYQGPTMRYLNFYGPPQTVTTIPYHRVISWASPAAGGHRPIDLKGKAVFVGHSTKNQDYQREGFFTVFSQSTGLDLSGVEIAATGFGNLLEDSAIVPLNGWGTVLVFVVGAMILGLVSMSLPVGLAALAVIGLGLCYLFAVELHFIGGFVWWPVIIPLFVQAPCGLLSSFAIRYRHASKERENVRKALEYYLPRQLVKELAKNIASLKSTRQLVYGICLFTDAEQYTALSEKMNPGDLAQYMNRYFETIFDPVRRHGGAVSNVVGDSMLALWISPGPDPSLQTKACLAALDITRAVDGFNASPDLPSLQTRLGLHSGHFLLSNIGAIDHYEYRPIGDIVNTATRIEGLNKYLKTSILVSSEVLHGLEGLLVREVGSFIVAGKSTPLTLYQLVGRAEEATSAQHEAGSLCAQAIAAFRSRRWEESGELFMKCKAILEEDGVSDFYIGLCSRYQQHPPPDGWDGTIQMDRK